LGFFVAKYIKICEKKNEKQKNENNDEKYHNTDRPKPTHRFKVILAKLDNNRPIALIRIQYYIWF
jgi:hypothetical protein